MNQPNTRLVRSLARGALIALLMSSAATAALAAPKHKAHVAAKPDPRDAKLQMLEQEVSELKGEMAQMRETQGAQQAAAGQVATLQQQVATTSQQLADVKTAQAAADANIITL